MTVLPKLAFGNYECIELYACYSMPSEHMHSEGYGSLLATFLCVCVCLSVCLSVTTLAKALLGYQYIQHWNRHFSV